MSDNEEEKHMSSIQHNSCGLCCVKINNFSVKYLDKIALDDINIHMHCGQITCIIGPNGAGKSTLLKAILNEVKHDGEVVYTNKDDKKTKTPIMGYVPQSINVDKHVPITVNDLLNISSKKFKNQVLLNEMGVDKLLNKSIGDLSGGEMQKVLIALAMYPLPDILLLDEPVANIDKSGIAKVYETISMIRKKYDVAIILVSHDLENVYEYADNVILLNKRVIRQGTPEEVYNSEEFKKVFEIGDNDGNV